MYGKPGFLSVRETWFPLSLSSFNSVTSRTIAANPVADFDRRRRDCHNNSRSDRVRRLLSAVAVAIAMAPVISVAGAFLIVIGVWRSMVALHRDRLRF
jgi:hypothetical protein